jgi:hypothetical protein
MMQAARSGVRHIEGGSAASAASQRTEIKRQTFETTNRVRD